MKGPSSRARLTILFLTVFVDLVGFGVVLPLLPFYGDRFGASGLEIGLLVAVYSAAQLLFSPFWGRLSDRFGRRPILIIGLVGSAASYLVFAYAGSLAVLFLSRVMAGVGGANIPVAQAYIADVTPPEERAGAMGLIGAAFGLGFIFGPAIGGLLAPVSVEAPGIAAAALCFANAVLAVFLLPESLPAATLEVRGAGPARSAAPVTLRDLRLALGASEVLWVLGLSFLVTLAFSFMHPTFPLFGERRLGLGEREVGYLFAFMGVVSAFVQGVLVRRLVPALGEARLVRVSAGPFFVGLLVIGLSGSLPWALVGLVLLAAGFGGMMPSLVSLLSRVAPPTLQGGILGVGQSVGALARILGPVLAGLAFDVLGIAWPYFLGAAIGVLALLVALPLKEPEDRPARPERPIVEIP